MLFRNRFVEKNYENNASDKSNLYFEGSVSDNFSSFNNSE